MLPTLAFGTLLCGVHGADADAAEESTQTSESAADAGYLWRHGMLIGVDYYPEHWPQERWETDLRLMRDAGFNVVRLAEFSWSLLEPQEGEFTFDWLDRAIHLCQKHGIHVILGTPTAVMPAWLARKHPEALSMKADGTRTVWGGRRHNCFSDPEFQRLAQRIVEQMAARYGKHPGVIGWQIDNELGGADCRCDTCRRAFHQWLADQYGDVETLNRKWGNHFWALNVGAWDEIPIPDDRVGKWAISNPSASLDWLRFGSHLNVTFLNRQAQTLRERSQHKQFVTHNFMGLFAGLDYYELARKLDFVSWDNYPQLSPTIPYDSGLAADVMHGLKGQNFLIMEQTAGPLGWSVYSSNPRPGELRSISYQQLAHGADGQLWFRWRSCTAGREQYWHGLLGHDGKPGRRYREAAQVAREYRKLASRLKGTVPRADAAIIYDYDSIWAMQIQNSYPDGSVQEAVKRYYNALWRAGVGAVIVPPEADLSAYKLVLAPHLHILPDAMAHKLTRYVADGGVLLTDCRVAVKDETSLAHPRTLPGLLAPALGIEIPEYESMRLGIVNDTEASYKLAAPGLGGGPFTAIKHADWITPTGAEAIATYDEPWLKDYAAVTRHAHGKGRGWYVGTIVREESFYDALIEKLLADAGLHSPTKPPRGVEVRVRGDAKRSLKFLINHTDREQVVDVNFKGVELLTGAPTGIAVTLSPFGVAVIELAKDADDQHGSPRQP